MRTLKIIEKHDEYRKATINLQASENYLIPEVRQALSSDMASRYSMVFDEEVHGTIVHNAYGGTKYQEDITELAKSLSSSVFGFDYTCVKPISGHIAAMSVLVALLNKGDRIMAIAPEDGGYDGYSQPYLPDMLGLKYKPLIIEEMQYIPVEQIMDYKPNMVILGASYILFPYNLREILEVSEDIGAKVVYDASHVLGLIPSGFQENIWDSLVVYGSTHKSYPGPQGGIIMSNDKETLKAIERKMTWRTQDNYHTNRVAALAASLEVFSDVAKEYGVRVRENSQTLARELHSHGLEIRYPPKFTMSHQILIDQNSLIKGFNMDTVKLSNTLENNGIIIDAVGRIGTAELTWKGFTVEDMKEVASLIISAINGDNVIDSVRKLSAKYNGKTLGKG